MIKEAIVKIVSKEDLTYEEAYTVMNEIMSGETTPTQNAAFLASVFPGSRVEMVPGAEHALPVVIPALIDAAVAEMSCWTCRGGI